MSCGPSFPVEGQLSGIDPVHRRRRAGVDAVVVPAGDTGRGRGRSLALLPEAILQDRESLWGSASTRAAGLAGKWASDSLSFRSYRIPSPLSRELPVQRQPSGKGVVHCRVAGPRYQVGKCRHRTADVLCRSCFAQSRSAARSCGRLCCRAAVRTCRPAYEHRRGEKHNGSTTRAQPGDSGRGLGA